MIKQIIINLQLKTIHGIPRNQKDNLQPKITDLRFDQNFQVPKKPQFGRLDLGKDNWGFAEEEMNKIASQELDNGQELSFQAKKVNLNKNWMTLSIIVFLKAKKMPK